MAPVFHKQMHGTLGPSTSTIGPVGDGLLLRHHSAQRQEGHQWQVIKLEAIDRSAASLSNGNSTFYHKFSTGIQQFRGDKCKKTLSALFWTAIDSITWGKGLILNGVLLQLRQGI